jgi:hypothetical protein
MRTLIVEDEQWRLDWFKRTLDEFDTTCLVDEAIRWLGRRHYDLLYLDHDLGTDPAVGRDVARWLAAHPDVLPRLSIVVHSVNVVSAPKILADLAAGGRLAEWVPFTQMVGAVPVG